MDTNFKSGMEVVVTAPNEVGVLARVSTILAEARINIQAICAYEIDDHAHLRVVTDNSERAVEVLGENGFKASEHDVLMYEVSPHSIHPDIADMAGGFEVESNYWCAAAHSGEHALLIFSPRDNLRSAALR